MAQLSARLNTQMATFPLLSRLNSRGVILPQSNQTYVPGVNSQGATTDRGIPSVVYAHNVMPSTYGLQAVGYQQDLPPIDDEELPEGSAVLYIKEVYGAETGDNSGYPAPSGGRGYFALVRTPDDDRKIYIYGFLMNGWNTLSGAGPGSIIHNDFSVATVNGVSYIYFTNGSFWVYDQQDNELVERTIVGLPAGTDKPTGITSAFGYMLAWNKLSVFWSSSIDVEDFVPDPITGAGDAAIQDARGSIVCCIPTIYGFMVFCQWNVVGSTFSGNTDFPFSFYPIPGSGGIGGDSPVVGAANQINGEFLVTQDAQTATVYAYTTNGFQGINHQSAKGLFPEITDYLDGFLLEEFDSETNTLSDVYCNAGIRKRVALIGDRYIVISYCKLIPGPWDPTDPGYEVPEFTDAIVVDLLYSRLGKLKINHRQCFEMLPTNYVFHQSARFIMGFIKADGQIVIATLTDITPVSDAVLILGKIQYVTSRRLELQSVVVENADDVGNFTLHALPSWDGKNFQPAVPGFIEKQTPNYSKFLFDIDGENHSLLFKGKFNVICAIPSVVVTGNM